MRRPLAGARLRRLRDERGLTQRALADRLHLSPSYVNQLENDQRPLTVSVLLALTSEFGLPPDFFAPDTEARLISDLQTIVTDVAGGAAPTSDMVRDVAVRAPEVAQTTVALHRRLQAALTELDALRSQATTVDTAGAGPMPFEEVRDFFYDRQNHVDVLDRAAEDLVDSAELTIGAMSDGLAAVLGNRFGIWTRIDRDGALPGGVKRLVDDQGRVTVAGWLSPGQQAFQLATQVALSGYADVIDAVVGEHPGLSEVGVSLARIGLANYFAGAVLLPYRRFHATAEEVRYDVDLLCRRFGVGVETVCHRLSTLQRPGLRGVPLILVRTDRAGNISKRQSATAFHFSRVGGGCPLWVVHDAFSRPDRVVTQVAAMPDGRRYLWMARAVTDGTGGFHAARRDFVIGLGCDIGHASRTVYADGLDLDDPATATPIGPGCKVCPREACAQRAFPYVAAGVAVDENVSTALPYVPTP